MLATQRELGRFEVGMGNWYTRAARPVPELLAQLEELHEALGDLRNEIALYHQQSRGQLPIRLCFPRK
jgi:hypothetical protein